MLSTGKPIKEKNDNIKENDEYPEERHEGHPEEHHDEHHNESEIKRDNTKEQEIKIDNVKEIKHDNIDDGIKEVESKNTLILPKKQIAPEKISIMVDFNEEECKFTIYDKDKNLLGNFNVIQLIKFVTEKINNKFINIETGTSKTVIRQFICKVIERDGAYKVQLLNHLESPFMGNIEMLMKLYKCIHKYISKKLLIDLEIFKIDLKTQKRIILIIKQLEYAVLNSMMKLIVSISEIIKNDTSKKEINDNLLRYSVIVSYRMSIFMKDELIKKISEYNELQEDVVRLGKIMLELYDKIAQLNDTIKKQNEEIKKLTDKIDTLTTTDEDSQENKSNSSSNESPTKLLGGDNSDDNDNSNSDEIYDEESDNVDDEEEN
jgi:uncharacterized coiled-coil protein SlyX